MTVELGYGGESKRAEFMFRNLVRWWIMCGQTVNAELCHTTNTVH